MQNDAQQVIADFAARLEAHFRAVHQNAMADVPICNPALDVACIGFQPWREQIFGIVLTPWFMNVLLAPLPGASPILAAPGATQSVALPCGRVDFLVGELDGFGRLLMGSLFSPMQDFVDQEAAVATAQAALASLLDPEFQSEASDALPQVEAAPPKTPAQRAQDFRQSEALELQAAQERMKGVDRRTLLRGGFAARTMP